MQLLYLFKDLCSEYIRNTDNSITEGKRPNYKMGNILEKILLQRRYTYGKQAHEKVLNINAFGNAYQHHEYHHMPTGWLIKKIITVEGVEKLEHCLQKCKVQPLWKTDFFKTLNIIIPYNPAIPFLEIKTCMYTDLDMNVHNGIIRNN